MRWVVAELKKVFHHLMQLIRITLREVLLQLVQCDEKHLVTIMSCSQRAEGGDVRGLLIGLRVTVALCHGICERQRSV